MGSYPSKTATLVPKSAFGQNYNVDSCVCSERPAIGQNTDMMMMISFNLFIYSSIYLGLLVYLVTYFIN